MKNNLTAPQAETAALGGFAKRLKSFRSIVAATLREIFDESAYARFLKQRQLESSRAAYAAFREEYEVTKARRPRCC
jgi:hypothetical protein